MQATRTLLRWLAICAAGILAAAWTLPATAQTRRAAPDGGKPPAREAAAPQGTIGKIRVEGTQRIETETVMSYLLIQPGDPWDTERVDKSLKALFATGLFADVHFDRVGSDLVIKVVENPIINRIAFEGNSKLADKDLTGEIQVRPRVVYTRTRVQNDVTRILDLYRRHAHFAATVEPKVIQLSRPPGRCSSLRSTKARRPACARSTLSATSNFSDGSLRSIVDTKESRWYRFFSNSDTYDPDRLTYDRELLRKEILPVAGLCRFPRGLGRGRDDAGPGRLHRHLRHRRG